MKAHRLVHHEKGRFWEVHWEGSQAETTSGALGTNGRSTEKGFSDSREADAWVAQQLGKRRKEGFVELTEVGTPATAADASSGLRELLARIVENPADDSLRTVYADQLSAAGDPLGEFIQVQLQLARAPAAVHQHREKELLERFRMKWSGGLRGVDFRFERGFAVAAHLEIEELATHVPKLFGVAPLLSRLHVNRGSGLMGSSGVRELMQRPEVKQLTELHFTLNGWLPQVIEAITGQPALDGLEALSLRRVGVSDSHAIDLIVRDRFTRLKRVDFRFNALSGGALDVLASRALHVVRLAGNRIGESSISRLTRAKPWAELRELDLSGNGIGNAGLAVLGSCEFLGNVTQLGLAGVNATSSGVSLLAKGPLARSVENLDLAGNDVRTEGVRLILGGQFPKLRHLDLSESMLGDEGVRAIVSSAGAAQLESLFIRKNQLSPAGAKVLRREALPALTELRVSGNPLGEGGLEALRESLPGVHVVARA
ncbi:MAG: TIGR02996 domain-containing protein [Archangium sp.]